VAGYRGLVNAAKAGRSRPHDLQLIASIAVEGRQFRTCLRIRLWVKSAVLTTGRRLPVYPDQRTSSDRPGWSGGASNELAAFVVARNTTLIE
jgi:hypothetical protein